MPLRARQVLDDCRHAASLLDAAEDPATRRVLWVATTALLRAVGHVLRNVDGRGDPDYAHAISEHWAAIEIERPRHPPFWEFIEPERNAVLKEYALGFDEGGIDLVFGRPEAPELTRLPPDVFLPSTRVDGEDARELVKEAIEWWEYQLVRVDQLASDHHGA
jgi:hypothetical protein